MGRANQPQNRNNGQGTHVHHVQHTEIVHEGPLPSPDVLNRYDTLVPGAAERIIAMAEAEMRHRQSMELQANASDISTREILSHAEDHRIKGILQNERIGQLLGGLVSIGALVGAGYTAYLGVHWSIPVAFVSLPVLGMVKALRSGRSSQQE
jgi:uncharacterized membrane protein